jgi:hypothetical protein
MNNPFLGFRFFKALGALTALIWLVACSGGGGGGDAPAVQRYAFSLAITGAGSVQSQPTGIDCAESCSAEFPAGTALVLTAAPAAGQYFTGWEGACNDAASTCAVTMDQVRSATATFAPLAAQATFTFSFTIAGTGTVASQPAGINCTADCSAVFVANSIVILTATPGVGQSFSGWSGACTGAANTCSVIFDRATTAGAIFVPLVGSNFDLSVIVSGAGSVASSPAGINCGSVCIANFAANTVVTLTATPAVGQVFNNWGGACTGSVPTCTLQLTQLRSVQAVFNTAPVVGVAFQPGQLLETNNDFNIGRGVNLLSVNRSGDSLVVWEQSDGVPDGNTFKVYSRRYIAATGWQPAVAIAGLTRREGNPSLLTGKLLMDAAGVATWINSDMETRRNTASTGWGTAFYPTNLRSSQKLTSAVMDASGNIGVLRSGSDVENNALAVGGTWGTWARVDNAGSAVSERAQVALSSNGTALAVWRESNPGDSNYSVKASRYTPTTGWGTPESIEALFTSLEDVNPSVVIDDQGNGIAMWLQGNGGTQVYYNIYRAGSGWQGEVAVPNLPELLPVNASIQLVMMGDGRAVAVWTAGGGLRTLRSMQYSPTTGWTVPVSVTENVTFPKMSISNSGQAVVIYQTFDLATARSDLVSRSINFGGQWSAASPVETGAGGIGNFSFSMNQTGQGVALWVQGDQSVTGSRTSLWAAVLR